jgi:hypothetical protein
LWRPWLGILRQAEAITASPFSSDKTIFVQIEPIRQASGSPCRTLRDGDKSRGARARKQAPVLREGVPMNFVLPGVENEQ